MFSLPQQLPIFQGIPSWEVQEYLDRLHLRKFPKGFLIYDESDTTAEVFAVLSGKVELIEHGPRGEKKNVKILEPGLLFGELSYLAGERGRQSAVAMEDAILLEMPGSWLHEMVQRYPIIRDRLCEIYRQDHLVPLLKKTSVFSDLSDLELKQLAKQFEFCSALDGELLITEGSVSEDLMIVQKGLVQVFKRQDQKTVMLTKLGAGSIFGEMALVTNKPRSASVKAIGRVDYLKLPAVDFGQFIAKNPSVSETLLNVINSRSEHTRNILENLSQQITQTFISPDSLGRAPLVSLASLDIKATLETTQLKMAATLQQLSLKEVEFIVMDKFPDQLHFGDLLFWTTPSKHEAKYKAFEDLGLIQLIFQSRIDRSVRCTFVEHAGMTQTIQALLINLSRLKLRGLIYPEYCAENVLSTVDVRDEKSQIFSGKIKSMSMTHMTLELFKIGSKLEAGKIYTIETSLDQKIGMWNGLCVATNERSATFQLEIDTPVQKNQVQDLLRFIQTSNAGPAKQSSTFGSASASFVLQKRFSTIADFLSVCVSKLEGNIIKLTYPTDVREGTSVKVSLIIEELSATPILNLIALVKDSKNGELTLESPLLQYEMGCLIDSVAQTHLEVQGSKLWNEKQKQLLTSKDGRKITVNENSTKVFERSGSKNLHPRSSAKSIPPAIKYAMIAVVALIVVVTASSLFHSFF